MNFHQPLLQCHMSASPALKPTVLKKAHGQVIADRIAHSVRKSKKYNDIICQRYYTLPKTVAFNNRSVELVGYRIK